jgi:hypothetical protein
MKRGLATALVSLALMGTASAAPPAPAKKTPKGATVDIVVTEIAGKNAYIKPGATAGVRRGAKVTIGDRNYVVSMATSSFAVIDLGD